MSLEGASPSLASIATVSMASSLCLHFLILVVSYIISFGPSLPIAAIPIWACSRWLHQRQQLARQKSAQKRAAEAHLSALLQHRSAQDMCLQALEDALLLATRLGGDADILKAGEETVLLLRSRASAEDRLKALAATGGSSLSLRQAIESAERAGLSGRLLAHAQFLLARQRAEETLLATIRGDVSDLDSIEIERAIKDAEERSVVEARLKEAYEKLRVVQIRERAEASVDNVLRAVNVQVEESVQLAERAGSSSVCHIHLRTSPFMLQRRRPETCAICCSETSLDSARCPAGHITCSMCVRTLLNQCIDRAKCQLTSKELATSEYIVMCCSPGCEVRFSRRTIAACTGDDQFDRLVEAQVALRVSLEVEELRKSFRLDEQQQQQESIRSNFRRPDGTFAAFMCPHCRHGPIDFHKCNDLRTHHNEWRSTAAGKRVQVRNGCPSCGFFAAHISEWKQWDGIFPQETSSAGASSHDRFWACPRCTYRNQTFREQCEMCEYV